MSLKKFKQCFEKLANIDTRNATCSPIAAKALTAFEKSQQSQERTKVHAKKAATHNFWRRVDSLYHNAANDAEGGVGKVTLEDLVKHFQNKTDEGDYYMGVLRTHCTLGKSASAVNIISIGEWHDFFQYIARDDSGPAETSANAAKALCALEHTKSMTHSTLLQRQTRKITAENISSFPTANFWMRATNSFLQITSQDENSTTRTMMEIHNYYSGKSAEVDKFLDLLIKDKVEHCNDESAGEACSLIDWQNIFRFIAESDTFDATTSPSACKFLAALEYSKLINNSLGSNCDDETNSINVNKHVHTHHFWKRVDSLFNYIDSKGNSDGIISHEEFLAHFRGVYCSSFTKQFSQDR